MMNIYLTLFAQSFGGRRGAVGERISQMSEEKRGWTCKECKFFVDGKLGVVHEVCPKCEAPRRCEQCTSVNSSAPGTCQVCRPIDAHVLEGGETVPKWIASLRSLHGSDNSEKSGENFLYGKYSARIEGLPGDCRVSLKQREVCRKIILGAIEYRFPEQMYLDFWASSRPSWPRWSLASTPEFLFTMDSSLRILVVMRVVAPNHQVYSQVFGKIPIAESDEFYSKLFDCGVLKQSLLEFFPYVLVEVILAYESFRFEEVQRRLAATNTSPSSYHLTKRVKLKEEEYQSIRDPRSKK